MVAQVHACFMFRGSKEVHVLKPTHIPKLRGTLPVRNHHPAALLAKFGEVLNKGIGQAAVVEVGEDHQLTVGHHPFELFEDLVL